MVRISRCALATRASAVARTAALAACLSATFAHGAITFSVAFDDPASELAAVRPLIEQHVLAAGRRWAGYLVGDGAIEVLVQTSNSVPFAEGRSFDSGFVRNNGAFDVFEQGMTHELRTGTDPNGADPDVEILINPDYANNELWYDPDPAARVAVVDVNRTDAMSTFLHEFGHALGFNGWINGTDGTFPSNFQSTYDERIVFDGTNFFFTGPEATALNGTPPALTYANVAHLANFDPRPGANLQLDLMNGLFFYRGYRYDVSPIDVAVLRDAGVPAIYLAGDYDVDRRVDGDDFLLWQRAYGVAGPSRAGADGDANGAVDDPDLGMWAANLGRTIPTAAASTVIPEPAAAALVALGVLAWAASRGAPARRVAARSLVALAAALATGQVQVSRAQQVVLASAEMGNPGRIGGTSVTAFQHVGWRFTLAEPLLVDHVGGHMLSYPDNPGDIFAAIVALPAVDAFPQGSPFTAEEVVATTTFRPEFPSSETLAPLSAALPPGAYALVFGTNLFGATSEAAIHNGPDQTDIPPTDIASFIFWGPPSQGASPVWRTNLASNMRVLVVGRTPAAADFDLSGDVAAADLSVWQTGFGTTLAATRAEGDATADGLVDGADFLTWQQQFDEGDDATTSAAPEPTALALLLAAAPLVRRRASPSLVGRDKGRDARPPRW